MNMEESVEILSGVGPKTAEILRKFGIRTVKDFLYNLPRDYDNYHKITAIKDIQPGKVVVKGRIENLVARRARNRNLTIIEGVIRDETGAVRVVWFNQAYRMKQFEEGKEYFFTGTYEMKNNRYRLSSPQAAGAVEIGPKGGLLPVYVAHGGLSSSDFRRLMAKSRDKFSLVPDLLPGVKKGERREALFQVHFPESIEALRVARRYLGYEELFELILAAELNRRANEKLQATPIKFDVQKIRDFVATLPFKLTGAQRRAAWEIFQDMEKPLPMNRLLQGDVGSGKTMVAAMAAYEAFLQGCQVALLAPTAILATQHFESLSQILEPLGVKVALLTGATKHKMDLKYAIYKGEINVVIGTHALLTDDTEFQNLGLIIIDEQHRFGVEQRQKLALKSPEGLAPHLLSMTATPIPRSLQLTIFGDLDVSVLDEMPAGRQVVNTQILTEVETREKLYPMMREVMARTPDAKKHGEKARGQQIYWICKAIEETNMPSAATGGTRSDDNSGGGYDGGSTITSVKTRTKRLREVFPDKTVEFLHGKMKPAEKDAVMERFSRGEIDILVSTTVVEVGVDVPNATLIVIENAETYGLAQLHQLRGRVGRGVSQSFCVLLTPGDMRPSRRLIEVTKSCDGFSLADVDLKMRGAGEIYGVLQHGVLNTRIASLTDERTIKVASKEVRKFLQSGENMLQYKELMAGITKYQQITTLN